MSELRTIKLYGHLGAKYGREHRLAVADTREAIQALCTLYPAMKADLMTSHQRGIGYAVFLGKRNITKEELGFQPNIADDIRIAPILMGSKKNGVFNIIIGVILVVVGVIGNLYGGWGTPFIQAGIGMIVGGVVQLLSPTPKAPKGQDRGDDQASYSFNGPVNTQAQGNPVPLLYGRLTVGSAVISAGISVKDGVYLPTNTAWSGGGTGSGGGGGGGNRPPWQLDWADGEV